MLSLKKIWKNSKMSKIDVIEADGFKLEFNNAISAYKFDETDQSKNTFHGVQFLKKVDVVAELDLFNIIVELKRRKSISDLRIRECGRKNCGFNCKDPDCTFDSPLNQLKNDLKLKCRDTLLYHFAERGKQVFKVKPIVYIVLIEKIDPSHMATLQQKLELEIPSGIPSTIPNGRWKKPIVDKCYVLNVTDWNKKKELQSTVSLVPSP